MQMLGIPIEALGIERNMRATWRLLLGLLLLVLTGAPAAAIGSCTVSGPRYRLASDAVEWSMRVIGRQICSRDFSLSKALSSAPDRLKIESVRLDSPPQSGQAAVEGSEFSYSAGADFQGNDSFIVTVSGKINGVQGSSTIRISVSDASRPAASVGAFVPKHPHERVSTGAATPAFTTASATGGRWNILKVGAGGYLTGASIASDNTLVVRADTYGAYIWNPSATTPQGNAGGIGAWQQLITSSSMPSSFVSMGQLYNYGVYEIAISPSNSNYIYMMYHDAKPKTYPPNVTVYQSTNKGQNWSVTNFTPVSGQILDANDAHRLFGQKMVVDPNSSTTVYAGANTSGLFKTTDGGSSWTELTGFPTPSAGGPGITGLAINPSDSGEIFGASHGNGVYRSADGGAHWAKLTTGTGPSDVGFGVINSSGTYFACDTATNPNLWIWNGSTWSRKLAGTGAGTQCDGIAINPSNQNWIRVSSIVGTFAESTDGGGTWSNFSDGGVGPKLVDNNIPWLSVTGIFDRYGLLWDQADPSSGRMIIPTARGIVVSVISRGITSTTTTKPFTQSVGIEQLVATQIIVPPTGAGATPLACTWDSPIFQPNLTQYPSTIYPVNDYQVVGCWSIDYASSNPGTFVFNADGGYVSNKLNRSGICTVGGLCTLFSSIGAGLPSNAYPNNPNQWGGDIAASSPDNILFAPGSSGKNTGTNPSYTLDGGLTWNAVSIKGISSWANFKMGEFSTKPPHLICADRVNPKTFYLDFPGMGIYYTSDGGASWNRSTNSISPGSPAQMHCTPGQAGDVWIATGHDGNPGSQPAGGHLYHITNANGGSAIGTACANVQEPYDVGFGAPKSGNTYPSIYIIGWVGVSPVWGLWRSDDQCRSWTQLDTWPNGSMDQATTISGDPNKWNRVYVGFTGSGFIWKQF